MLKVSPVGNINRELDIAEKKHFRKIALKIIIGIVIFSGICTVININEIVSLVSMTILVVLISQYLGLIKYEIEKTSG